MVAGIPLQFLLVVTVAGVVALAFTLSRRTFGKREANRGLTRGLGLMAVGVLLFRWLSGSGAGSLVDSLWGFFPYVLSALEWYVVVTWPIRRKVAGRVAEDLGSHPLRVPAQFALAAGLLASLAQTIEAIRAGISLDNMSIAVFGYSSVVAALALIRSRVCLTENGILRFEDHVEWKEIRSWKWIEGGTLSVLQLKVRWGPFTRTLRVPATANQRIALDAALMQNVARQEPVSEGVEAPPLLG